MKKLITSLLLVLAVVPMSVLASEQATTLEQALANYEQANQQYQTDYANYQAALNQYQQDLEQYNQNVEQDKVNQAQYEKDLVQYEKDMKQYQVDYEKYTEKKKEYDDVIKQMEADKNKPGHLSEAIGQSLTFASEPNAKLTITGGTATEDIAAPAMNSREIVANGGAHKPNVGRLIKKGETVTATYSGLKNSAYAGRPIAKMVNTFTLDSSLNGSDQNILFIYNDPTDGFYIENLQGQQGATALRVVTKFYYADGTQVEFLKDYPAIINVASLNNNYFPDEGSAWREEIVNYNFRFVKITGSTVNEHKTTRGSGALYADEYTNVGNGTGNAFDLNQYPDWDFPSSPDFWRVAGAGVLNSGNIIDYTIYCHGTNENSKGNGGQWTAYNTTIANNPLPVVPTKPVEPTKPVPPTVLATTKPEPPIEPVPPVKPNADDYPYLWNDGTHRRTPQTGTATTIGMLTVVIAAASILYIRNRK